MNIIMKTLIIGYYDRQNTGDDTYKHVLHHIIGINSTFVCSDDVNSCKYINNDYDRIIVGGGDVLNRYFLDKVNKFLDKRIEKNKICPTIALSVGIPHRNDDTIKLLKIFDYIFSRSLGDTEYLRKKGYPCKFIPDVSALTRYLSNMEISRGSIVRHGNYDEKKDIGVFIAHEYFSTENKPTFFRKFCYFLKKVMFAGYNIKLYTMDQNISNSDDKINKDILLEIKMMIEYDKIAGYFPTSKIGECVIAKSPKSDDIFSWFAEIKELRGTICFKYHSILFSWFNGVPCMCIHSTRKIRELMKDVTWEYQYELETTKDEIPINFNFVECMTIFENMINDQLCCDKKIAEVLTYYNKINVIMPKCREIIKKITCKNNPIANIEKIKEICIHNDISDEETGKYLLYNITRRTDNSYVYGFLEKIKTLDLLNTNNLNLLISELKWVKNDYDNTKTIIPSQDIKCNINLTYIDQNDYVGYHRSGWQYVLENMYTRGLNNEFDPTVKLFDAYIDRTFMWNNKYNKICDIIPYKKPWVGVIHHTFCKKVKWNAYCLFENHEFKESLKICKGLIVLSNYLKEEIVSKTSCNVPIYVILHPTDLIVPKWKGVNGKINLVHIGAWMRNIPYFYELNSPIQKYALKWKGMWNLFPTKGNNDEEDAKICRDASFCRDTSFCRDKKKTKYVRRLSNGKINSVILIENTRNDEYDKLLQDNVVFLNLFDASAVNTIIECMARNTPIIINRLPAIEEMLGKNYPLFYKTKEEAESLITYENFIKANNYLGQLDKSKIDINLFLQKLQDVLISC